MVEESRNEACLYEQRRKYRNTNIFESESSKKKRLEKEEQLILNNIERSKYVNL